MRMVKIFSLMIATLFLAFPVFAQQSDPAPADGSDVAKERKTEVYEERKPAKSNLPLNFYGRNGLIFTSSTHVLEYKDVELGLGYTYESSKDPKYTKQVGAYNMAVGLPNHFMLYAHVPYIFTDLEYGEKYNALKLRVRDFSVKEKNGFGTVEGGFQWAFFMQDRFLPGMAAGLSFMAPTGDYTQHLSDVKYYGFKANLAMSMEIFDLFFTDYAFAILADGSLVFRDVGIEGREYEEKHGLIHAGMIFPLHPRNFINLILEYDGILMKGTTNEEDLNGLVMGLRFITNRIGVTAGAEYIFNEPEDLENLWRFTGVASYRFW